MQDFLGESRRSFEVRDENSATTRGIAYQVSLSLKTENNKELQIQREHLGSFTVKFRVWGFLDEYKSARPWLREPPSY